METADRPNALASFVGIILEKGATPMMMRIGRLAHRLVETDDPASDGYRDPLAHPALKAMSSRELADLPFPRCAGVR